MKNTIIVNQKSLKKKIDLIKKDGLDKFFVLSDFDGTLTKVFYRGKTRPSVISILRSEKYLTQEYSQKAFALYEKYHPIEINPKISRAIKKKKMEEWWRVHYELLKKTGLRKHHLKKIIDSGKLKFRAGFSRFLTSLKENSIPLVILSSSGLGGDMIFMLLKKEKEFFKNIFVASNILKWRKDKMVGVKEPIVHSANKEGSILKKFPNLFKNIRKRKNVLVLDNDMQASLMLRGLNIKNSIKVGFLNENVKELLPEFKKQFDVIILNDGPMNEVNNLLKELLKR